ncbi:MAG: hypothetical protein K2X82_33205 [Gemmataceae bacterium]|nr:hypothetical protein [Gemmataceae bacterium]
MLVALVALVGPFTHGKPPAPPGPAVELELRLDKAAVRVGDKARLRELVPQGTKAEFGIVRHEVVRIGTFDGRGRLTNLKPADYEPVDDQSGLFEDLPHSTHHFHGLVYTVQEGGLQGIEFTFTPDGPGVYLLTATWVVRGGVGTVTGPPVVLTVRPKAGGK